MNTQIFQEIKYDLKGHGSSHEAFLAKFFPNIHLSTNFEKKNH